MQAIRSSIRIEVVLVALAALLLACAGADPQPAALPDASEAISSGAKAPKVRKLHQAGWVEVQAQVLASESESPAEARARAVADARRAAVEHVAGVRVRSSLVTYDGVRGADAASLVQSLTASRADALVVEEKLLGSKMLPIEMGGYRMHVLMRAKVLDRSTNRDPGFKLQVELDRERFLAGEDVALSVRSSRDANIYVLGITEDSAAVLLPNKWLADTAAEAGQWIRFPGDDLRERGVRLVAQVPDGRDSSTEALVAVALRGGHTLENLLPARGDAFRASDASGAGQLLADLLTPLSELPPDSWAFDQVVYEVYAR